MRTIFVALVGVAGVAFTVFALVRLLAAMRANAPRELVLGWMALMVIGALVSFVLVRAA